NPPMKETPSLRLFKDAAKNLGYHPFQLPSGNITENYENPDGQVINQCQYCAFCTHYGCDFGAKSDPIVTVIPAAKETGDFELRTKAKAGGELIKEVKEKEIMKVEKGTDKDYEKHANFVV